MKKRGLLFLMLAFSNVLILSSCGEGSSSESIFNAEDLVFEDKVVTYDGSTHSLEIENLPEGAQVTYSGNNQVEPGQYSITARVKLPGQSAVYLEALLTIEKKESVLTAETVQQAYAYLGAKPVFSLNNNEQEVEVSTYYRAGKYQVDLYAKETEYYKESNHVIVEFEVLKGNDLGVSFDSVKEMYDGTQKQILASNIPEGYTVTYENNSATKQGKYNAACKVFDPSGTQVLTLNALLEIDNTDNEEFNEYLDELFVDYIGDDYFSWNLFMEHPENFGFIRDENDKAQWYTYETIVGYDKNEYFENNKLALAELQEFKEKDLSFNQMISYKRAEEFIQQYVDTYDPSKPYDDLMGQIYIDSNGGYPAVVAQQFEAMAFRNEQDVKDILDYLESLPAAFESYLVYAQDKVTVGYPISDRTIDAMIDYLDDVYEKGTSYYLIQYLKNKFNECTFLDENQKSTYCNLVDSHFTNYFFPAFKSLSEGLVAYKGNCTEEGYFYTYGEKGKAQYEFDLRNRLGLPELDMDEYEKYLADNISEYSNKINNTIAEMQSYKNTNPASYDAFFDFYEKNESVVGLLDPNDMLGYLDEFAKTIVPELAVKPNIEVTYMDMTAAEVSNAVAYYYKSELDSDANEAITLNPITATKNPNDLIATMAHEGYPGHMYAYRFSKELGISNFATVKTSTAHGEGWATYVSLELYDYMKDHNVRSEEEQQGVAVYMDYLKYNDLLSYPLYAYIDHMIHMEGWKVEEISKYLDKNGFNPDAAEEVYYLLIEMPTQYSCYGYGMLYFYDLHLRAQEELQDAYDVVEFNQMILSHGWCSLASLGVIVDEYLENTKLLYNL